jgi:hypothetical protein
MISLRLLLMVVSVGSSDLCLREKNEEFLGETC